MMESENTIQDNMRNESDSPHVTLKRTCNGTRERETKDQIAGVNLSSVGEPENTVACNGTAEIEDMQVSCESKGSKADENLQNIIIPASSEFSETDVKKADPSECVNGERPVDHKTAMTRLDKDNATDEGVDGVAGGEALLDDCDMNRDEDGSCQNVRSNLRSRKSKIQNCMVTRSENSCSSVRADTKNDSSNNQGSVFDTKDGKCSTPSQEVDSPELQTGCGSNVEDCSITNTVEIVDVHGLNDVRISEHEDLGVLHKDGDISEKGDRCLNNSKKIKDKEVPKNIVKTKEDTDGEQQSSFNEDKEGGDAEYENKKKVKDKANTVDAGNKSQKVELSKNDEDVNKDDECADSSVDDIEIIGESKVIMINKPNTSFKTSQNVFIPGSHPATSSSLFPSSSKHNTPFVRGKAPSSTVLPGFSPGIGAQSAPRFGGVPFQGSQNVQLLVPPVAPPKPKSSLDQIELIRWEIQNRINTRPKYFKPSPSSDLGPLAKFLYDIGSDLMKEAVYHDLVKIQSRKNNDDKLNDKEKDDLAKLKEIEKDLFSTIGHLKLKLKKRCQVCNFHTESSNVMYYHKQYPHEDNKCMRCGYCSFVTKQAVAFKYHMESEHSVQPKLNDRKALYECDLCPYENNQEQKVILHKQRCLKQFRPLFNLHPSCLSGAEINLCLENIFYKVFVPKPLKVPPQKSLQQQQQATQAELKRQAAQAEARRQQAEIQALAAQKNAAAIAAKKQQQLQKNMRPNVAPRFSIPPGERFPVPGQQTPVRYNAKGPRPTVANILNNKQNPAALPPGVSPNAAAGGFEVCEICEGYVKDRKALRIHFFYAHRIDLPVNLFERSQAPLYCATCYVRFWTAQGLRKHIDSHKEENQTRGVVGKCISCGHHVLNLLLHMRVVHNREMQHYINALMCMFCGSYFGSRQECEQHILKVHGHVDPVTGTLKSTPIVPTQQQTQKAPPSQKKAGTSSLVKGSVCVLCNLNFGRNVDLTRHCMRMHHTCMKCGMVVIDKASLMKHTCLSSLSGTRDCSLCQETGFHPAYYVKHLRDKHLRKFTINVGRLSRETIEQWLKRPYPFTEKEEVPVEISDSDEDASIKPKSTPAQLPSGKRQKIGPACKIGRNNETPAAKVVKRDEQKQDVASKNDEQDKDVTSKIDEQDKDVAFKRDDQEKDVTPKKKNNVQEVIDLDTREINSVNEDRRSDESPQAEKRKSSGSPASEKSSKRKKSS